MRTNQLELRLENAHWRLLGRMPYGRDDEEYPAHDQGDSATADESGP